MGLYAHDTAGPVDATKDGAIEVRASDMEVNAERVIDTTKDNAIKSKAVDTEVDTIGIKVTEVEVTSDTIKYDGNTEAIDNKDRRDKHWMKMNLLE